MNKQIQEYLDTCEQSYKDLIVADKEKNKVIIPQKSSFLTDKNEMDLIKKYMIEKDEILKTALVTLFKSNSVIIEGVLSIRNQEFRRYRERDKLDLNNVKEIIYNYCNYLNLTEDEKEVLDFCLKLVRIEDYDSWRGLRSINDIWDNKTHKLDKKYYIFDKDEEEFKSFEEIELYADGDIKFVEEEHKSTRYRDYFNEEQQDMLVYQFQNEIKGMKDSFDKELKVTRVKLEKEIEEIKIKCGKYLLVASLRSGE